MLDLKFIRENQDIVRQAIKNKNEKADLNYLLELDTQKRKLQFEYDQNKALQNKISKSIPVMKKEGKDISEIMQQMKEISDNNKYIQENLKNTDSKLRTELLKIPNIPASDVPIGDESHNEFIREWGTKPEFDFVPKEHLEIAAQNKLLETKIPNYWR